MSERRSSLAGLPHWPRFLRDREAARYLGVPLAAFRREVAAGVWPAPMQRGAGRGGVLTWDRSALDQAADALGSSGKPGEARAHVDTIAAALAAARRP